MQSYIHCMTKKRDVSSARGQSVCTRTVLHEVTGIGNTISSVIKSKTKCH